ncbi:cytochrome c oxidase assembly protein COX18, mitochondrial isoform X1 [Hippoglossus hippoglossus]|uniref:cytochrome c oxidase assembly protein COX18, mitochondrial isoform X1 n=1 Tax=Hippoglossus hippoglossus TaxID=8267 RepID=UPI00148E121B|nr:cytochrome c oxidase assembly protein COX18, mitochondrial isoform X1 [Hippoglossus hippoglossus]
MVVTMLSVGGLARSGFLELRLLQLPARGVCSAVIHRKSPACVTWCAGASVGPPSARHRLPVRMTSGVGGGDVANDAAGVVTGASGWCGSLADSAPVHLFEHFLVSAQQVSGLPWWLSIVAVTLSVRTLITLPLAAYQLVIISKVEALQVEISELAKRLRYEVSVRARERGWTEKQSRFQFKKNLRRIVSQLYVRENCHPFKASLLVWVQFPLWVSLSVALRNLSLHQSAVQCDLAAGGALWFPDLSSPDSTWILPLGVGLINLLIVEVFFFAETESDSFPEAAAELHPRVFCPDGSHRCYCPLELVSVLVHLQSHWIQSQPRPSFSCDSQTPQTTTSWIRDSVQRPAFSPRQQIPQINTQYCKSYGVKNTHEVFHICDLLRVLTSEWTNEKKLCFIQEVM